MRQKAAGAWVIRVVVSGWFLLAAGFLTARAGDMPARVADRVKTAYPEATVEAVRYEQWKVRMVYEVEIETPEGEELELIISEDGELLEVEEEEGLPWIGGDLSIGAGVMVESDIYRGTDTEVQPAFFFRYENNRLALQAYQDLVLSYSFFRTARFNLAVVGAADFNAGYDPDDSTYLSGMDELDTVVAAGLAGSLMAGNWELCLEVLQDVSGEHDGQEVTFSLARTWTLGAFELTPSAAVSWISKDAVDYFYGVSAREARADRAAYSPGDSYEAELEFMVQRKIYGDFTAVGVAGITAYGSDITDSPIVEDDYSAELVLGIVYAF